METQTQAMPFLAFDNDAANRAHAERAVSLRFREEVQAMSWEAALSKLAMAALNNAIDKKLSEIDDVIKGFGLKLPEITLIARDPDKPGMVITLSNGTDHDIMMAFLQAKKSLSTGTPKYLLKDMELEDLRAVMTGLAKFVELGAETFAVEKPLFVLLLFNQPQMAQYIGNCERADMIKAMRSLADRLEQRQANGGGR